MTQYIKEPNSETATRHFHPPNGVAASRPIGSPSPLTMEALGLTSPRSLLFLPRASPSPAAEKLPFKFQIRASLPRWKGEVSPGQPSAAVAASENAVMISQEAPPQHSTSLPLPLRKVSSDALQYPPGYLGAVPDRTGLGGGGDGAISAMGYLTNILSSKVYDVAMETPLQLAPNLSERLGVNVWLKREDLQPVSSSCIHSSPPLRIFRLVAKVEAFGLGH